jgi:hypothetical protein
MSRITPQDARDLRWEIGHALDRWVEIRAGNDNGDTRAAYAAAKLRVHDSITRLTATDTDAARPVSYIIVRAGAASCVTATPPSGDVPGSVDLWDGVHIAARLTVGIEDVAGARQLAALLVEMADLAQSEAAGVAR